MNPIKISVVIITFNEENNIGRCLESVKDIADEIVVLDSFSSDETAEICSRYNVKFIQQAFEGHIEQKNAALSHSSYSYVLSLDADEALSKELLQSISAIKLDARYQAYEFNRLTFYAGHPIKTCGWYPDRKIRLWCKDVGEWGGINPHDKVVLDKSPKVKFLEGDLLHYSFADFWDYVYRQIDYAKVAGQAYHTSGEAFNILKLFINPLHRFLRDYFWKRGFTDKMKGLMISLVSSFTVFLKYYTYYLLIRKKQKPSTSLVISTYNWPEALELSLISVQKQSILPDEVIIADDGSGKDTKSIIEKYKSLIPNLKHSWHEDGGFRKTIIMNQAFSMSTSELIMQIDGDMILHKNFIEDHINTAEKGYYTQGSRVLINKHASESILKNKRINLSPFSNGISNRVNAIRSLIFRKLFTTYKGGLIGTRGCNMAFWREDLLKVNGYNEDIIGWGKEDTELIVRLYNLGVKRKNLKFGGIQYHIYHPENSREQLETNVLTLNESIGKNKTWCENGITTSSSSVVA